MSNKLLALFFLANAVNILTFYLNWHFVEFFLKYTPRLVWSLDFFAFSIGPLLFLYTLSLVRKNFKIKAIFLLLFIPFTVFAFLCFSRLVFQSHETIRKIVTSDSFLSLSGYAILNGSLRLMNLTLATISFIVLFKYKKGTRIKINAEKQFNFDWFFIILTGISIVFIIEAMNYISFNLNHKILKLYEAIHFVKFIVFNSLIFYGLKNSSLFESIETSIKYSKSQLMKDEKEILLEKLRACMAHEKYFLTPSITVQDVADKMGLQPRQVSQVINELTGQNFIDFVNTYRIEEAKKMLIDPKYRQYSILGILYEAGFNSKTAFNNTFKKQTGYTPKEYKLQNE